MKNILTTFSVIAMVVLFTSCAVTLPYAVTDNPVGSKKGVSSSTVILGSIYLNGNFGLADACKAGKITGGISTVDKKTSNFVLFSKVDLIVTGE